MPIDEILFFDDFPAAANCEFVKNPESFLVKGIVKDRTVQKELRISAVTGRR